MQTGGKCGRGGEKATMNKYSRLFSFLSLPGVARDIAFRTLTVPFYTDTPFNAYGFVPALIPLWATDSPSYTGYWKHWFVPHREPTFVEVYVRDEYRAIEVARNFMQLMRRSVLTALTIEGAVTPDIQTFAMQVGITDVELEEIASLTQVSGDDDAGLLTLPAFVHAPPLACYHGRTKGYFGDFPHDGMALTEQNLYNICTFEVSEDLYRRILDLPFAPPWFTTTDQPLLFTQLLQQGNLQGAWMSLNSTGWRFLEAKKALKRLGEQSNTPGFDLLVEAWTEETHENSGVTPEEAEY